MSFPPIIDPDRWVGSMQVAKYNRNTVLGVQHDLNGGIEPVYADFQRFDVAPDEVTDEHYNQLVNGGLDLLINLLGGAGGNAFTNTNAIVGVGNSSTAFALTQAALVGDGSTTTAWYQGADASNPTYNISGHGVLACNATVATGNANWAWNEWCFATGSGTHTPGGTLASVATGVVMINRKVVSLGTKVNTAVWVAQGSITES